MVAWLVLAVVAVSTVLPAVQHSTFSLLGPAGVVS